MPDRASFRVGVFIPNTVQLLDLAGIDVMASAGHGYLAQLSFMVPAELIELAPDVSIVYISQQAPGSLLPLTAEVKIAITHHYADAAVAPGTLDAVYIPGPDPMLAIEEDAKTWLAKHAATAGVDILSVCTGIFVCGQAGLLTKGRKVCGPKGVQHILREKYEGLELVGHEYRWAVDGNLWSSGGVTNGNDMVAEYMRKSAVFPNPVCELAFSLTEVGDRGEKLTVGA